MHLSANIAGAAATPSPRGIVKLLLMATLCTRTVTGHGYMTEPESRQYVAYKNNGWTNPGPDEYDPHGIAAGGMYSECADCPDRGYPGVNPWSAPGTASSLDFTMGNGHMLGVCGSSPSSANDYNAPSPFGVYGHAVTKNYRPGDVIDVSWCVSADHGGIPQFRLCADEALVSAVLTPGVPPSLPDLERLEACFQEGMMRCDSVDSNTCGQVKFCDANPSWEACEPGKHLHCYNEKGTENKDYACVNTAKTCDHGTLAEYKLKIPEDFPESDHTILSYRWDTSENNEVFVGCADVSITRDGTAPPTEQGAP